MRNPDLAKGVATGRTPHRSAGWSDFRGSRSRPARNNPHKLRQSPRPRWAPPTAERPPRCRGLPRVCRQFRPGSVPNLPVVRICTSRPVVRSVRLIAERPAKVQRLDSATGPINPPESSCISAGLGVSDFVVTLQRIGSSDSQLSRPAMDAPRHEHTPTDGPGGFNLSPQGWSDTEYVSKTDVSSSGPRLARRSTCRRRASRRVTRANRARRPVHRRSALGSRKHQAYSGQ